MQIKMTGRVVERPLYSGTGPVLTFELIFQVLFFIGLFILLILFLQKSRFFRSCFMWIGLAYLIFGIAAYVIAMNAMPDEMKDERLLILLLLPSFLVAIWIPYVQGSLRVRKIFIN